MDDKTARQIRCFCPEQALTLFLDRSNHTAQALFDAFAKDFSELNPAVRWEGLDRGAALPGFILKENIRYCALPLERELAPFLSGLAHLDRPAPAPQLQELLERITHPCRLTLYIALHCPHCPAMVETLIPLAAFCDRISLEIIDGTLFPEKAREDQVMSAPCLILDNDFRWTGTVPAHEILSMILNRDPSQLSVSTLKNILEAGDAAWIAGKMMAADRIFDGFVGLLLHETWSVRLGAMVVVEALAQDAPNLARHLAPILTAAFNGREIPVQGDLLYALGEVGDEKTADWIRGAVTDAAHQDLRDAAQEALEAIESRS